MPRAVRRNGTNWYGAQGKIYEQVNAIAVDADGNVIVTGDVQTTNGSGIDTIKYSNAGAPLWTNSFAGGGSLAIAADKSGDVFVTGLALHNSGIYPTSQYLTLAYSSAGTLLWTNVSQNRISGNTANSASAVTVTSSGNVVVTGQVYGGQSQYSYMTIAYSSAGLPLWTNVYNGGSPVQLDAYATAIAADANGNVFVTGYSISGGITNSDFDYTTIKYSAAGAPLWTNRYNGVGKSRDYARAIAVDSNGNVFVTGYSSNSNSHYNYATVAYSNAGVPLWTNWYEGTGNGNNYARAIAVDNSGGVFVTGYSTNNISGYDYVTVAYSNTGVPLWTKSYDGPASGNDYAVAIGVDGTGNVFVTGHSAYGTNNYHDYATVAYSNQGTPFWTNSYSGLTNSYNTATALAVDSSGNVFVTGYAEPDSQGLDYTTIRYASSMSLPAQLGFHFGGDQLLLDWTDPGFQLQSAPAITGPFTNVPGATSPYTNFISDQQQYFRLISP